MSKINFNLKDRQAKSESLIYAILNYNGKRFKHSTGHSIHPKFWNSKSQRVRESMEFQNHRSINSSLSKISNDLNQAYDNIITKGILPNNELLKKEYDKVYHGDGAGKHLSFWKNYEDFIAYKKDRVKDIRDYNKSLRKHLEKTEEIYGEPLSFELLKNGNGFIDRMDHYLTYEAINSNGEEGLSTNTVGKQFKNLKAFLNWIFDRGIFPRFSLKHMVTKTEEIESVYLTHQELESLYDLDLTEENKLVRDLFIIGCETGLRFSDFSTLNDNNIKSDSIHIRPKKTEGKSVNNKLIIPMSKRVKYILQQYPKHPPVYRKTVSEFNKTLRGISKKAEIDETITLVKSLAGKYVEEHYKKFELISSHTARRTFCTLKFLDGMPAQAIMQFSGHKTERAFMKYLKIDSEIAAEKYQHFF